MLGPNGSGKSTFFRIAATLLAPDEGSISVFGETSLAAARRSLGVVFQNPSLDGKLKVSENLAYAGRLYGLTRRAAHARAAELLERFQIADRARDRVEVLSGGQKRRVEIAKALLHRPRLLLLDEPSTGLDPQARRELAQLLDATWKTGTTLVLTTHLLEEADGFDDVVILDRGRIVARGAPHELKSAIGGGVIRLRAKDRVALEVRLRALGIQGKSVGDELRIETADRDLLERTAHSLLVELSDTVDSIEIGRPSLEDVFASATGRSFHRSGVGA